MNPELNAPMSRNTQHVEGSVACWGDPLCGGDATEAGEFRV